MKQLYYTSCRTGKSVNGNSGFQVRSVSAGVAADRIQAACRYAGYKLPQGTAPESSPDQAPVRLSLLDTPDAGRLLCYSSYVGQDPTTGRYGNFFSHLLLDVPAALGADLALLSWQSSTWQCQDNEGPIAVPELSEQQFRNQVAAGTPAGLKQFLANAKNKDMMGFLLQAHLVSDATHRIFFAAPPQDVVTCLKGLVRCLPPRMIQGLTFSTYESDPLTCSARVIGTCWDNSLQQDLPSSCYSGNALGFNRFSGKQSPLPSSSPYVAQALQMLCTGSFHDLENFLDVCRRLDIDDPELLNLLFEIEQQKKPLSKQASQQVLQNSTLACHIVERPGMLPRIIQWAVEDSNYRQQDFPRCMAVLRRQEEQMEELRKILEELIIQAVTVNPDRERTEVLLEKLFVPNFPNHLDKLWGQLLREMRQPPAPWDLRSYLIPTVVKRLSASHPASEAQLRQWLETPPEQIPALLRLDLDQKHKVQACVLCLLKQQPIPETVTGVLAQGLPFALAVMKRLAAPSPTSSRETAEQQAKAVAVFEAIAIRKPQGGLLEQLLAEKQALGNDVLDQCLVIALRQNVVSSEELIHRHRSLLEGFLSHGHSPRCTVEMLFNQGREPTRWDGNIIRFLEKFQTSRAFAELPPALQEQVQTMLGLEAFLQQPHLEPEALTKVTGVFGRLSLKAKATTCGRIVDAVAAELLERDSPEVQGQLEDVLSILGPNWPAEASQLYSQLIHKLQENRRLYEARELLKALVAVGLGQTKPFHGATSSYDEELQIAKLCKNIRKHSSKDTVGYIIKCAGQENWHEYDRLFQLLVSRQNDQRSWRDDLKDWKIITLVVIIVILLILMIFDIV